VSVVTKQPITTAPLTIFHHCRLREPPRVAMVTPSFCCPYADESAAEFNSNARRAAQSKVYTAEEASSWLGQPGLTFFDRFGRLFLDRFL
jgi:hypothetical protein